MAVVNLTMDVTTKMQTKMLNNWMGKTIFGAISVQQGSTTNIGDAIELQFGGTSPVIGGGTTITHEGPTDLTVYNNQTVKRFMLVRDPENPSTTEHAFTTMDQLYEYGGVFRINEIEIILT